VIIRKNPEPGKSPEFFSENPEDLATLIWENISQEKCEKIINNIPKRLKAIVQK
jgi:hypothetical protein